MEALDAAAGRQPVAKPPFVRLERWVRANCRAKDAFRIAFGVIWLIDAGLKWQPAFRSGFTAMLKESAQGQPGWLHGWFHFWINLVAPNSGFFAYSTAAIETLVAVALLVGFARKLTYISAALFSVLIWATAEGFGGPYTSSSTDIGTAVVYAVVFLGLLALNYEAGPSRFSVDYLIEQRVSWWHRVAEIGPRAKDATPPARTKVLPVASAPVAT
jgi:nitrite reductase (NO-forming)